MGTKVWIVTKDGIETVIFTDTSSKEFAETMDNDAAFLDKDEAIIFAINALYASKNDEEKKLEKLKKLQKWD